MIIEDPAERTLIQDAMNQLMFDVGTPIPGQVARKVCVFFRPAVATDKEILTIQYGLGCSASVSGSVHSCIALHQTNFGLSRSASLPTTIKS